MVRKDPKTVLREDKGVTSPAKPTTVAGPNGEPVLTQNDKRAAGLPGDRPQNPWVWGGLILLLSLIWFGSGGTRPWAKKQLVDMSAASISYEAITGHFVQDNLVNDLALADTVPPRFGLIDSENDYWHRFSHEIKRLNFLGGKGVKYKVIFLERHGQGFHNVAEAYYGTKAWDKKWSLLNGNGTITWGPDAKLTSLGIQQAEFINSLWKQEMDAGGGVPIPTKLFSSPLSRAAKTMEIAYNGVAPKVTPLILENLREEIGMHTCDKRVTKTEIQKAFPGFEIEQGFTEEDELWRPDWREPGDERDARIKSVLDDIFRHYEDSFIGIAAHAGVIRSALRVINHRPYEVSPGGLIPVVIKATFTS